jgi:zinc protease
MAKLIKEGFPLAEVASAKSGYAQAQQLIRADDSRLAYGLATKLYLGRTMAWDAALDRNIQALKPADIQAALKKYLQLDGISYVNAGDFAKATQAAAK